MNNLISLKISLLTFYKNTKVELVQHTGRNNCNCNLEIKKNKLNILTPLSNPINVDKIPQYELDLYLSAFSIAKKEIEIGEIHLRPHPRDKGKWSKYLCNYLNKNGFKSIVTDTKKPIHEIICNYQGVIGESSCVLRDAANSCNYCFVVGLEKLSLHRYRNPQFVFGNGENISWINKNGKYDSSFFNYEKKAYYPNIKTVYDFL